MNATETLAKLYNSNRLDREEVVNTMKGNLEELFIPEIPIKLDNSYYLKEFKGKKPSSDVVVQIHKGLLKEWNFSKDRSEIIFEFENHKYSAPLVCFKTNILCN